MSAARDIEVEYKLHADVRSIEDEWYGVSDPVARRKLQNRLNQRARRRRRIAEKQSKSDQSLAVNSSGTNTPADHGITDYQLISLDVPDIRGFYSWNEASARDWPASLDHVTPPHMFSQDAEALLRYRLSLSRRCLGPNFDKNGPALIRGDIKTLYPLPADHLLSLIYYNVYRAFISNMQLLNLDFDAMCSDNALSSFLWRTSEDPICTLLPSSLQPTDLQRSVPHHPIWDIFPDPVIRDNILLYGEDNFDDVEFCLQIMGDATINRDDDDNLQQRTGLIVWGEPWDTSSWEVSEHFAKSWPWFLRGAMDLLASTNRWRATREEPPIVFEL